MPRTPVQALKGALRVLSRPVRADTGRRGVVIHPYRGFGSAWEVFVMGRVVRQPRLRLLRRAAHGATAVDFLRRMFRRGVRGARVRGRLAVAEGWAETDFDGYFRLHLRSPEGALGSGWKRLHVTIDGPSDGSGAEAVSEVYLRPPASRFVVVSDIDDTVVETGVASKLRMFRNLFFERPEDRVAYPGVAAFYRALHRGASGAEGNPMLYVSRGPWAIYEVLERFFRRHRIPEGPILYLREWGMTLQRPLPPRARDHKLDLIRCMLHVHADAPFVLIGDSGQSDPEIYARLVHEHPGRVLAIYIRNVGRDAGRDEAIGALAAEAAAAGTPLVLAADSSIMARHAAEIGLIETDAPDAVARERVADRAAAD